MTRQLPLTPSAAHLRKQAKNLLHQCQANNAEAIKHVRLYHPALQNLTDSKIASTIRLCDTQLATAHEYGFQNWASLCSHVGSIYAPDELKLSPIEDPRFAELEFRAELARQKGLPAIGSTAISRHGVKYTVTDYQPAVSPLVAARISRGGPRTHIDDLLPIIAFPEISARLMRFCMETDCATSKDLMFLDTLPRLHPTTAAPGLNQVCSINGSTLLQFQLDASNIHETIIAHEMGHIWIEMIEGIEDYRHLRDQSNSAKVAQFQHLQSFVLDLRVNELLQERGFDMSIIRAHQTESIQNIANHCVRGERPRTVRAAAGLINTLASVMIEQRGMLTHRSNNLNQAFEIIEIVLPSIYEAAGKFVSSVERHGYRDMEAIQQVVDECTALSFAITGDIYDPHRDLIERKPTEWMQDKHPDVLPDLPVNAKLEVYRTTAKLGIFGRAQYNWTIEASGRCDVTISTREGATIDPVVLTFQVSHQVVREWQHPRHSHSAPNSAANPHDPRNYSAAPNNGSHVAMQSPPLSVRPTPLVLTAMQMPNPPSTVLHEPQRPQHFAVHLPMSNTNGIQNRLQHGSNSPEPPHTPHAPVSVSRPSWPNPNAHGQSRSYSAGLGLWLSQVGFEQQMLGEQTYGYALNNPVTFSDPSGRKPTSDPTLIAVPSPPFNKHQYTDPSKPPDCSIVSSKLVGAQPCSVALVPIWVTCYKGGTRGHNVAQYCKPGDTVDPVTRSKSYKQCQHCSTYGEFCDCQGEHLGKPLFPELGHTVCLLDPDNPGLSIDVTINDCGCGQKVENKPDNAHDIWIDIQCDSPKFPGNHWECYCPHACYPHRPR